MLGGHICPWIKTHSGAHLILSPLQLASDKLHVMLRADRLYMMIRVYLNCAKEMY